jgi:hypothetical protein
VLLLLLNFYKILTQVVPGLAAPGVANTIAAPRSLSLIFSMVFSMIASSRSAAPRWVAPQQCRATEGGTAAVLRQALLPCLPHHSLWRRTPAAPRPVAPHHCRATPSGAAGLELKIMLKIMLEIKLKLKITNISANMLKIK